MSQGLAQPEPERLLSAEELASILGMSLDWSTSAQRHATSRAWCCQVAGASSVIPRFAKLWTVGGRSVASIRKRRGRFEVRWRDGGGQRSRTFTRKADADRFKVEVERQAQLGSLYEAEPVFFSDGWLERFEQRVRPSTYARAFKRCGLCPSWGGRECTKSGQQRSKIGSQLSAGAPLGKRRLRCSS